MAFVLPKKCLYLLIGVNSISVKIELRISGQFNHSIWDSELITIQTLYAEQFKSLENSIRTVLEDAEVNLNHYFAYVCIFLYGTVNGENGTIKFLNWEINTKKLEKKFGFEKVVLLNKSESVCHSIISSSPEDIVNTFNALNLNSKHFLEGDRSIVIKIGTGFCASLIIKTSNENKIIPVEGGHIEFVPKDKSQFELKAFFQKIFLMNRVEIEHIVSGIGLDTIYCFLSIKNPKLVNREIQRLIKESNKPGSVVCEMAQLHGDVLCRMAIRLFTRVMASEIGNIALRFVPFGGVFIFGEWIPALVNLENADQFVCDFLDKEKSDVLLNVPVFVQRCCHDLEMNGAKKYLISQIENKSRFTKTNCAELFLAASALGLAVLLGAKSRKYT